MLVQFFYCADELYIYILVYGAVYVYIYVYCAVYKYICLLRCTYIYMSTAQKEPLFPYPRKFFCAVDVLH